MKNLKDFEAPSPYIEKLSELIFLATVKNVELDKVVTMMGNVKHGKPIGGVGEIGLIGSLSQGCKEAFEKFAKDQGLTSGYATAEDYLRGDFGYDEIDEWLFDSTTSRVGTAGVVPVYGENDSPLYYVMVACFGEGEATWYVSVQDDILEEKYNTWHDKAVEDYSAGLTVNYSTLKVIG